MIFVSREQEGEEHLLDSQWKYLLRAFDVEEMSREEIGDLPVVVIQPRYARYVPGTVCLSEFSHPDDPIVYLFGGSHSVMRETDLAGLNIIDIVYIPVHDDWELFSSQAASIVLWDRISNG